MLRHVVRLAAATLAVAAAGVVVPPSAQATTCSSASGVSVVVDFHQLGGGVQTFCDAEGAGEYADRQFADAGHTLTYVQNEPFVCRVDGAPASDPCVHTPPADAYWSLWWSDGKSGTWSYASSGVASLKVPAGGYVALSWQQGDAKAKPGVSPRAHGSQPTSSPTSSSPSSSPSHGPTHGPAHGPTSSAAPGGPTTSASPPAPTATAGTGRHAHHGTGHDRSSKKPKPGSTATDGSDAPQAVGPAAGISDGSGGAGSSGSGGLPGWVAPVAVAALFVGVGAITVFRRKSSGGA